MLILMYTQDAHSHIEDSHAYSHAPRVAVLARCPPAFRPLLQALPSVHWRGVMLIPPLGLSEPELRGLFCSGARWADQLGLEGRSMGMSNDWPLAAECGSRIVRVGSSLFGLD